VNLTLPDGPLVRIPILFIGRKIDESVERLVAGIEIQRGHMVAVTFQTLSELSEVSFLEENGNPVVDGLLVVKEIILRRMHGNATRPESVQRVFDEIEPLLDRTNMFQCANRPAKIIVAQVRGYHVHIHISK
jgi:hypothetical protein